MIEARNLTKRYGTKTAVDGISFTIPPGTVTGFLGPNGAGKSTTMRVLVGLTPATSGTATVHGRRFVDLPNPGREVGVLEADGLSEMLEETAVHLNDKFTRLFDEMLKLLQTGHAVATIAQLRKLGLARGIYPLLDVIVERADQPFVHAALQDTDRTAIVTFALRNRTRLGALRVRDDVLVLQVLLWDD